MPPEIESSAEPLQCDVFIAGGGLVGASLALMLAQVGLDIVMAEAVAPGNGDQPLSACGD
jgi:2-polyprenyl-6-methoxyphenol hydroxylase-like FAD-dependent oxidoreductase